MKILKHFFLLFVATVMLSASGLAQDDAISRYFEKYMDNEEFSMIHITPKLFEMLARIDIEIEGEDLDNEIMEIVKGLKGLRVLSYDGVESMKYYKDAKNVIDENQYEILVNARDNGENVHIWVRNSGDIVRELFVIAGGKDEFVALSFLGDIDIKKVGRIASFIDIQGTRHLKKLEER